MVELASALGGLGGVVTLGFVIKLVLNRLSRAEKSLENKVDKDLCKTIHTNVKDELKRDDERFERMFKSQELLIIEVTKQGTKQENICKKVDTIVMKIDTLQN